GLVTGMVFFGGLKWTIERLPGTRHPFTFALISMIIRAAFVVGVLLLVGQREWQRYVVVLIGILLARLLAVRVWGRSSALEAQPSEAEGD
ncbi:MAG: ATP synthase subunit I, partial [Candidatus Hydrogenedentes bacterium]|nr:ATP synthase subunit I [Candidatus Hydrogenedentota bacterium]